MNKLKELSKKKWFIVLIIIIAIALVGSLGTYAMFSWISTDNTNVTLKIGDVAEVFFPQGQELNTNNLTPVFNYTDGETLTFSIKNKDQTNANIRYTVNFNITNIDEELANSSLKYKLVSGNNVIGEGDFSTATNNSTMKLAKGMLSSGTTNFTFYLYIDSNIENNPNMMNRNISGVVEVTASEASEADVTLTRLGLTVDTTHTPNFGMISGNNGVKWDNATNQEIPNQGDGTNGIYEATDDLGTTYYFRGAVTNNYVTFGGLTWRIVRINGDGTIRIALNQSIGTSAYNTNTNDNAYVGYMYGDASSSTYVDTHANTNNSTIKTYLDNWYEANLLQYEDKIADAIYCNDRSVVKFTYNENGTEKTFSGTGVGTEETAYAGYKRIFIDHTPSLVCPNNNDKFTVSNALGNGALRYPIGLLTLDEYQMAGAGANDFSTYDEYWWNDSTDAFYLFDNNNYYWSMTPVQMYASGDANVGNVSYDGLANYDYYALSANLAVRPAVSLKSSSITGGSGTSDNPFVVG